MLFSPLGRHQSSAKFLTWREIERGELRTERGERDGKNVKTSLTSFITYIQFRLFI